MLATLISVGRCFDDRHNGELTRRDAEASKLLIEDRGRNLMGAADEKARDRRHSAGRMIHANRKMPR
jgi:hypothetical protein